MANGPDFSIQVRAVGDEAFEPTSSESWDLPVPSVEFEALPFCQSAPSFVGGVATETVERSPISMRPACRSMLPPETSVSSNCKA
ncbi:hypothetical protein CDN99_09195 [Roseateles aquatilis]|uniref:Uncharacterized protein n=1 Tax=Roseateles aquatilis TaxID=431061 RepID=A0A246JFE8_9BURK|nr:hypothetical protein CDN99_09195 [Roseateles aquatilis]